MTVARVTVNNDAPKDVLTGDLKFEQAILDADGKTIASSGIKQSFAPYPARRNW